VAPTAEKKGASEPSIEIGFSAGNHWHDGEEK
jgi:hypothetical protein